MYYPAGYSSSEDDEDFRFLTPSPAVEGREAVRDDDWHPTGPGNPSDLEVDDSQLRKVLERTKKNIRAVLTAVKGGLDLGRLEQEYYDTFEETIPWQTLKFPSLEELLLAIPSVCEVRKVMFSTLVTPVLDQNTQHIRQLVNNQGKAKKKGGRGRGGNYQEYRDYQNYRPPAWADSLGFGPEQEGIDEEAELSWGEWVESPSPPVVPITERGAEAGTESLPRTASNPDQSAWLERLEEIVTGRRFGLLIEQIERSYEERWGTSLPQDWREQLELTKRFVMVDSPDSQSWVRLA